MEMLAAAGFLATANLSIVNYLADPVRKKFPDLDLWWLVYVALATGFAIGWFSEINLFLDVMPEVLVGRILTGIVVGGGSSLIYNVFHKSED